MNHSNLWERLIAEARAIRLTRDREADDSAPFGFATRVLARVREVRETERRLALWQRVAWRSALASLVVCGAVFLSQRGARSTGDELIVPPAIEWSL
jgi:hypothetical protein